MLTDLYADKSVDVPISRFFKNGQLAKFAICRILIAGSPTRNLDMVHSERD